MPTRFDLDDAPVPTAYCQCGRFQGQDTGLDRTLQFADHWVGGCPAVAGLSFHPDGSLAGVTFRG